MKYSGINGREADPLRWVPRDELFSKINCKTILDEESIENRDPGWARSCIITIQPLSEVGTF